MAQGKGRERVPAARKEKEEITIALQFTANRESRLI